MHDSGERGNAKLPGSYFTSGRTDVANEAPPHNKQYKVQTLCSQWTHDLTSDSTEERCILVCQIRALHTDHTIPSAHETRRGNYDMKLVTGGRWWQRKKYPASPSRHPPLALLVGSHLPPSFMNHLSACSKSCSSEGLQPRSTFYICTLYFILFIAVDVQAENMDSFH